jgi:hypothetical protein
MVAVGCGSRSTPSESVGEKVPTTTASDTGTITIRFKDWT